MRATTRLIGFALCFCCLWTLPSKADDEPRAQFVGVRCGVVTGGDSGSGTPEPGQIVCQILEDPQPFGTDSDARIPPTDAWPFSDSIIHLLFNLNPTLQLVSPTDHGQVDTPDRTP
jgi:hypothetical protein